MKRSPENSVLLRIVVVLVVLVSLTALLREEYWPLRLTFEAYSGVLVGSWISWVFRYKKTILLRIILGVIMLWIGFHGIYQIITSPYDPRVPLSNLLIRLLMLHSFDTPARKDLLYSLLVSFVLMTGAAVFSVDLSFGFFLILYAIFIVIVSFVITYLDASSQVLNFKSLEFQKLVSLFLRSTAFFSILMGGVSLFLFLFFPRIQGYSLKFTPISIHLPNFSLFHGKIANPDYPVASGSQSSLFTLKRDYGKFNPNSYFGFNPYLDLSLRGKLSNKIVMKVKSQEPGYWRGMAFDKYTGDGWTITRQKAEQLNLFADSVTLAYSRGGYPDSRKIIQTYYITASLPNLIFSIYEPATIYFPSSTLYRNSENTVTAPFYLSPGTEYTVVSRVPTHLIQLLKNANPGYLPDLRYVHLHKMYIDFSRRFLRIKSSQKAVLFSIIPSKRSLEAQKIGRQMSELKKSTYLRYYYLQKYYLQLPQELPNKVRRLAEKITENHRTMFGKIMAILNYLHQFPYTLDIPPPAPDEDAVSQFLFHLKKGYCEQFASAFAVLARCVGIPTRLVTGYATGSYNPFTMEYVVREKDAHAWDEVYFPDIGWIPFDSSPAFSLMPTYQKRGVFIGIGTVLKYFKSLVKALVSRRDLEQVDNWIEFAGSVFAAGILLYLFFAAQKLKFHWKNFTPWKRFKKSSVKPSDISRKKVRVFYRKLERFLARRGYKRTISETPLELIEKIEEKEMKERVMKIIQIYEQIRFSPDLEGKEDLREADHLLQGLKRMR
jgi:transglutaminase-like putative cysteine protease